MSQYHEYLDGPTLRRDHAFRAGDTVYLSFLIGGYTPVENNMDVAYTVSVTDPQGQPLVETKSGEVKTELAQEDKKWTPKIRAEIPVPGSAPSGLYHILISLNDRLGKSQSEEKLTFQVTGKEIAPSATLSAQNLEFYRREEDRQPLPKPASYRAGDAVWVRFDIVGFKTGEKNRLDLHYGVRLTNASGKALVDVPEAASETGEFFYPRRFVGSSFSIDLQKGTPPGEYTLKIILKDGVGQQTAEVAPTFRIE